MKPILKWVGGKRAVLPQLLENLPKNYNTYYEPFLGSGTLFFELEPEKAVIADVNEELINFYKVLAYYPNKLVFYLGLYKNTKEFYYKARRLDRSPYFKTMDRYDKAARFYYLNKTAYGGLYRVNKKGHFNVPYGNYKNTKYQNYDYLLEVGNYLVLNGIQIVSGDYQKTLKTVKQNDFVYLDPPYYNSYDQYTTTRFNLNKRIDSINNQVELKRYIDELTKRNIFVMLSNSDEQFIINLYKDYNVKTINLTRALNSKSKKRKTTELLITNY